MGLVPIRQTCTIMRFVKGLFLLVVTFMVSVPKAYGKIPDFRIGLADSTYFGPKDLKADMPTLFYYYSATCEDCQRLTATLLGNKYIMEHVQVVLLTNESLNSVKNYKNKYKLDTFANVRIGTEGFTDRFIRNFPVARLPFLVYYASPSDEGRLLCSDNEIDVFIRTLDRK